MKPRATHRGVRRVTANLPADLLAQACRQTGKGVTETLVEGLDLVRRRAAGERLLALRGKLSIELDLDEVRGRARS